MACDPRRELFDQDAERYDRARPGYPRALLDDLVALTGIGSGSRVLEIGPGTGQATGAVAASGAQVVAVELGPGLATVLRRKFAGTGVEVIVSAFEDWAPPTELFDAVCSFTAWHWLDPALRTRKTASLLCPGGALATVTAFHVAGGTDAFFADAQRCYERWDPATPPGVRLQVPKAIRPETDEADSSPLFLPPVRRRYTQDITYTAAGYLDLLNTYSGHLALDPESRHGLLSSIGDLIDNTYGGAIVKRYLYELRIARTPASP